MDTTDSTDWNEYRMHVLNELQRLDENIASCESAIKNEVAESETRIMEMLNKLQDSHSKTRDDVIRLKALASVVGAASGFVAGFIVKFIG